MSLCIKSREDRVRRLAKEQGFLAKKNPCRTPEDPRYQGWMIVDGNNNFVVAGGHLNAYSMDLEEVEAWLEEGGEE